LKFFQGGDETYKKKETLENVSLKKTLKERILKEFYLRNSVQVATGELKAYKRK
jgi:hypothetical protein